MARELTLRIIIEQAPPGVDFALQKGSGNAYEAVQKRCSGGTALTFEFKPSIRQGVSNLQSPAVLFFGGARGRHASKGESVHL